MVERAGAALPVSDRLSPDEYGAHAANLARLAGEAELYLWVMFGDAGAATDPEEIVTHHMVKELILATRRYAQAILDFSWVGYEWDAVLAAADTVSVRRDACREVMARRSYERAPSEMKKAFADVFHQLGVGA